VVEMQSGRGAETRSGSGW